MATQIFKTDNGKTFSIVLDPGYCFAMSVDLAKVILTNVKVGQPKKVPNAGQLSPGKWAIVQSAYELNRGNTDTSIVEAQGLDIAAAIPQTAYPGDAALAKTLTALSGANVFGIMGNGAHAMLWYRDDANGLWLVLDPNLGLYQCDSLADAEAFLAKTVLADPGYADLKTAYDNVTVVLA